MIRPRIEDAFAYTAAGQVEQAVSVLQGLVVETPAHATVHVLLAQGYERLHRWPEALGAWQAASLLLPDATVVRQGALRAARVLAALRTMAESGESLAMGTPEGPRLVPVETPQPTDVHNAAASSPQPHSAEVAPSEAIRIAPPLQARRYDPDAPHASTAEAWTDEIADAPLADALPEGLRDALVSGLPEDRVRTSPDPPGFDLDALIGKLSDSGPIRPRADLDAIAPPDGLDAEDDDDPVSETLARIYAGQRQFAQAARIYERLAELQPAHAARFRAEADALRQKVIA
ncbi:MAG: hypothetical protein IAE99_13600 [Rhodothermales bacterium]|nr:hypothetical protein [Rhodothermales bacterium]